MKTFSIIVPVYNAGMHLSNLMSSILGQIYEDFEVILIDDGSTDNSAEICDFYSDADLRIKVVHQENRGVSAARNRGLDLCQGRWVIFADADDYFIKDAFTNFAESVTDCDLVMFNAIKEKGGYRKTMFNYANRSVDLPYKVQNRAVWAYLFQYEIIKRCRIRFLENLAYSEDTVFLYQYMMCCNHILQKKNPVYVYVLNENSACASKDGMKIACYQFVAAKELKRLISEGSTINCRMEKVLKCEVRKFIRMGIYSFLKNRNDGIFIKDLWMHYTHAVGLGLKQTLFFYCSLLSQYALIIRRKIIQIHKL